MTFDFIPVENRAEISPAGISIRRDIARAVCRLCSSRRRDRRLITGFCCKRKFSRPMIRSSVRGVHLDAVAAWESIQRVKAPGETILPLHDLGLERIGG